MEIFKNKRILLPVIAFLAFTILLIIAAVYVNTRNKYGNQLEISNLSSYTAGKATDGDRVDLIKHYLYETVKYNSKKRPANNSIKDIVIRKGSFSQKYDKTTNVYTVNFIVDIASLKQSYDVSYQWQEGSAYNQTVNEYGTQVTCLAIDKLIYGDFNCVDERILEKGKQNYDPVEKILPYVVKYKYAIKDYTTTPERGEVTLKVEAFVPSWSNQEDVLTQYTNEIKAWLKSRKLDPGKYNLDFIY